MNKISDTILDTIGHTPLVRINRITRGTVAADVLAKIETFNPGNSIKDRMALKMIEDAEQDGRLKPGGTIIEGTSGNTGMGLAIAAVVKGYKCIFTTTDKQSKEKVDALRAFGADVIVCPTDVDPEDPRSYYSVSSRLERETPNSWKANQYRQPVELGGPLRADRPRDPGSDRRPGRSPRGRRRHRRDHLRRGPIPQGAEAVGEGMGHRHLRVGVQEVQGDGDLRQERDLPYITEGIGEDFLPKNVDFSVIDHFEKVTDRDAAIMTSRIAREEGIFAGNSAGSALAGLLQLADRFKAGETVVVIFHDHGTRYLGKMYNPDWMREKGFLDKKGLTAKDLVADRQKARLTTIECVEPVGRAANLMTANAYSQLPVTAGGRLVGSVSESHLFEAIVANPELVKGPVEAIMEPAIPFADISTGVDALAGMLTDASPAVLVRDFKSDETYIITRWDVIKALS